MSDASTFHPVVAADDRAPRSVSGGVGDDLAAEGAVFAVAALAVSGDRETRPAWAGFDRFDILGYSSSQTAAARVECAKLRVSN